MARKGEEGNNPSPRAAMKNGEGDEGVDFSLECPLPASSYPVVTVGHGGGGKLMHDLIERIFLKAFSNQALDAGHDGAELALGHRRAAFTTDSYVVRPLFFPGGDIGKLAVFGTSNDLAMCGARPLHLSAAFILEEGLPLETLERVARSMAAAAREAGVRIVTGDTKVVERGRGDGMFITTAGVGEIEHDFTVAPASVAPGDAIILSGDIGRHGIAVMSAREGLSFENPPESDCAPLWPAVEEMLKAGVEIHCLRDLTRGGLATSLVEIARSSRKGVLFEESAVPVSDSVRGACEILGLDPLFVANEGRLVAFVPAASAEKAVAALRASPVAEGARIIGAVEAGPAGSVTMKSRIGGSRVVDMLSGEQLPRIC